MTSFWRGAILGAVANFALFPLAQAADLMPLSKLTKHTHIHGLAITRQDPGRLLVATHHGVFAAGADGMVEKVSEANHDFMGFTPHPKEASVFLGSGHPAGGGNLGFIRSTDGARSWVQVSPGLDGPVDFHQMDVSPSDPDVIYGVHGSVQVSRDGGKSWVKAGKAPPALIDLAVSPGSPDRLYAATEQGLAVSGDGGASWSVVHAKGVPVTAVQAAGDGTLYAFVLGQGLQTARDPATAWKTVGQPEGARYLINLAVDPNNSRRVVAVDDKGQVVTSGDGGASWGKWGR